MAAATQEIRTGTIASYYDQDTGLINDQVSGQKIDFYHQGAQLIFEVGSSVTYLYILLPTGKVIVSDIKKPA